MARIIDDGKQNIIGGNLKKLRLQKKMSQKELSDKLETVAVYVCRGSISRVENGERAVTDIEILGFSQVLKVPIEKLFEA